MIILWQTQFVVTLLRSQPQVKELSQKSRYVLSPFDWRLTIIKIKLIIRIEVLEPIFCIIKIARNAKRNLQIRN